MLFCSMLLRSSNWSDMWSGGGSDRTLGSPLHILCFVRTLEHGIKLQVDSSKHHRERCSSHNSGYVLSRFSGWYFYHVCFLSSSEALKVRAFSPVLLWLRAEHNPPPTISAETRQSLLLNQYKKKIFFWKFCQKKVLFLKTEISPTFSDKHI